MVSVDMYIPHMFGQFLQSTPQKFNLGVRSTKVITLELVTKSTGKLHTIIQSIVNNTHTLPIIFKANVVNPFLAVSSNDIEIKLRHPYLSTQFSLSNTLNVPVQYLWNLPPGSCFTVKPISGTILSNRSIVSEVYYHIDYAEKYSSKIFFECSEGMKQNISATVFVDKLNVTMMKQVIDVVNIPLNIEHRAKAIILNTGFEPVFFSVRNPNPIPGITITPAEEVIRSRSYQILYILIVLPVVISFECTIYVDMPANQSLHFVLKGNVKYPHLVLKPNYIHLKRIIAGSFEHQPITMLNQGDTPVKIEYVGKKCPEFKMSNSFKPSDEYFSNDFLLQPGEKKKVELMFFPIDVSMNKLYLPIVINDILGPPSIDDEKTILNATYFKDYEK